LVKRASSSVKRAAFWPLTHQGFTLLELMVVLVIIAVSASLALLALPPTNRNALDQDSAQLAALLDAARSYAAAVQAPVRLETTPEGYQFVGIVRGSWQVLEGELRPRNFLTTGAQLSLPTAARNGLLLGPEPVSEPSQVSIALGAEGRTVSSDGASPFFVAPAVN
jgi:general secretion pathway protein H